MSPYSYDRRRNVRVASSEIPVIIEEVRMEPHTYQVCPHCRQDIHEKALYFDGTNWFHSAPECLNKPIAMPPSKPEVVAWWKERGVEV